MTRSIADALSPGTGEASPEFNFQEIEIFPDKKTTLIFQFMYQPEYIGVGNNLIINMDYLKAFGKITQIFPEKVDEHKDQI